jgi:hypothetical protein
MPHVAAPRIRAACPALEEVALSVAWEHERIISRDHWVKLLFPD